MSVLSFCCSVRVEDDKECNGLYGRTRCFRLDTGFWEVEVNEASFPDTIAVKPGNLVVVPSIRSHDEAPGSATDEKASLSLICKIDYDYIEGQGMGAVAKTRISLGERILAEKPILKGPSGQTTQELETELSSLSTEEQEAFWKLHDAFLFRSQISDGNSEHKWSSVRCKSWVYLPKRLPFQSQL
eukprot:gnl/MRDRNA2_/MRDRNA2_32182_c0_seq1.p2 gnl/MRDRNA2_/MRDRNA2_32182_c0~~gnl/MRDRNA2_/MRDRNA2_32182_c0_seq1.p2  ORF type:complete len:185 (-),score=23.32 gnl/MRDRNA2_/MRDRNA2_32182_c0_seq1:569-1123(-)